MADKAAAKILWYHLKAPVNVGRADGWYVTSIVGREYLYPHGDNTWLCQTLKRATQKHSRH